MIGPRSDAIVKNIITVMDVNLTLFPTPQFFSQDMLTALEEDLSSFVNLQLISIYNQTSYQLIDSGISITKTFPLTTTGHCRYLKKYTPLTNLRNLHNNHRFSQQSLRGTTLNLFGHMVFQNDNIPDPDSAKTDFISAMSQLTLLLDYLKQVNILELQKITFIALSGQNISYQNDYSYNCSFSNNLPQTGNLSVKNVVIGSTVGAIAFVITLSTFLFIWRRSRTRLRSKRKVFRLKHLSDDESLVPSTSSDHQTSDFSSLNSRYVSLYANGHEMNTQKGFHNNKEDDDGGDVNRSNSLVKITDSNLNSCGDPIYFFKPIEAFAHSTSDDFDYAKNNTLFPLHFDDSLLSTRDHSPLSYIVSGDEMTIDRKIEPLEGPSVKDVNTHIGAFPSRIPAGSFVKTPNPYSDTITLGSDNTSIQQSLTSASTRIHPLDWSYKGSVYEGYSVGNTTMTDKDLFIVNSGKNPSILEVKEGVHESDTGVNETDSAAKINPTATCDPVLSSDSAGSKQFVNDLVWLKQKLSDFGESSHDDNSSYGSASHSSN